jgi:hypothetical protein
MSQIRIHPQLPQTSTIPPEPQGLAVDPIRGEIRLCGDVSLNKLN